MSSHDVTRVLGVKRREAKARREARLSGEIRIAVQVGHCSQAVGAREVALALESAVPSGAYIVTAGCDGACFDAPQVLVTHPSGARRRFTKVSPEDVGHIYKAIESGLDGVDAEREEFFAQQRRLVLSHCGELDSTDIDDYILHGGYEGLARVLETPPEEVMEEVRLSGLRGRGGAYFPPAAKWESVRKGPKPAYLVVNSEEGEPGIFKDRHIMEGVPHRMIEGASIAAYAAGVNQAYVYINAEADLPTERIQRAVDQAMERGLLGDSILGTGFSLHMEIWRGAGGYICGEETTLLNSLEGRRREPRLRPPYPTEAGLWGMPTVINNAETLASIPFIITGGAESFSMIGTESDHGTKLVSLSGSVRRPGVAEVPMGMTLRQIVYDIGGGPPDGRMLTAMAVGGPSSGVFSMSMLDTPIRPGVLHETGVMLGAGGVIALDERADVADVVRKLAAYNAAESCGKCTPCREGTPRIVEAIDRLVSKNGAEADVEELRYLVDVVGAASLCGLGQAAGGSITSGLHFFPDRFASTLGE